MVICLFCIESVFCKRDYPQNRVKRNTRSLTNFYNSNVEVKQTKVPLFDLLGKAAADPDWQKKKWKAGKGHIHDSTKATTVTFF